MKYVANRYQVCGIRPFQENEYDTGFIGLFTAYQRYKTQKSSLGIHAFSSEL